MADLPDEPARAAPKRIEIIARGLARRDGALLLCRSVPGGHSYMPGGHVEPGEAAADALARELLEETGLESRVGPLLLVAEARFTQAGRPRHEINLVFHVEHRTGAWPERVPSLEPDIRFEWVAPSLLADTGFVPADLRDFLARYPAALDADRLTSADAPAIVWRSSSG